MHLREGLVSEQRQTLFQQSEDARYNQGNESKRGKRI